MADSRRMCDEPMPGGIGHGRGKPVAPAARLPDGATLEALEQRRVLLPSSAHPEQSATAITATGLSFADALTRRLARQPLSRTASAAG